MAQVNENLAKTIAAPNKVSKFRWIKDIAGGSNDVALTVPKGRKWRIISIRTEYTATAGAANRIMQIRVKESGGDVLFAVEEATVYVASDVRIKNWSPGANLVAAGDATNEGQQHFPAGIWIGALDIVQILDKDDGVSTDSIVVHMLVEEVRN